jgi:dihydrofolate synthase/folylpolyglutamate synthase
MRPVAETRGGAAEAAKTDWVFSPDPVVEALISGTRAKHAPLFPEDTRRIRAFLSCLGDPHLKLPPVFHVAGTNGKGSTLAFLQAIFEAAGLRVHKYTSPHLARFEERIVLGGKNIAEDTLSDLIRACDAASGEKPVSFFEFFTALAFLAFSQAPADVLLLETGLGGMHDATNVVPRPAASILTRISFDHMHILGGSLPEIARHKAGILRKGTPAAVAPQPGAGVMEVFRQKAAELGAPLFQDWAARSAAEGRFAYNSENFAFDLPLPRLQGRHQIVNAGTAMAALEAAGFTRLLRQDILEDAMRRVSWPGRLQRLREGPLIGLLPPGCELWLDGAHNDSGAEALADQAVSGWNDGKPLDLVTAFKRKKDIASFYGRLQPHVGRVACVEPMVEAPMLGAEELCGFLTTLGFAGAFPAETLETALRALSFPDGTPRRILITGSLYLVGRVLRNHA